MMKNINLLLSTYVLCVILQIGNCVCAQESRVIKGTPKPFPAKVRGINLGRLKTIQKEQFEMAGNWNINCARVFLDMDDWKNPISDSIDIDSIFLKKNYGDNLQLLDTAIEWAREQNFKIIICPGRIYNRMKYDNVNNTTTILPQHRWSSGLSVLLKHISSEYKNDTTVVGYELLNEPGVINNTNCQERGICSYVLWNDSVAPRLIKAIRSKDTETPIIVEPAFYQSLKEMLQGFNVREIQNAHPATTNKLVYSFHYYFHTRITHNGVGVSRPFDEDLKYPCTACIDIDGDNIKDDFDKAALEARLDLIENWRLDTALQNSSIMSNQIYIGEFSAVRKLDGANEWVVDVLSYLDGIDFNNNDIMPEQCEWHWTYHSLTGATGFWNPTYEENNFSVDPLNGTVKENENLNTTITSAINNAQVLHTKLLDLDVTTSLVALKIAWGKNDSSIQCDFDKTNNVLIFKSNPVEEIKILPNPTFSTFKVKLKLKEETDVELRLTNVRGHLILVDKKVAQKQGRHEYDLYSSLVNNKLFQKAGTYFLEIKTNKKILVQKIIKL